MTQQIIGFHGRKQSGKNTSCNFLLMLHMLENGICKVSSINDKGNIEVSDILGQTTGEKKDKFEFVSSNVNVEEVQKLVDVKIYSFADALKRMCIDLFGLDESKVYGTDADKSEKTHLKWQDMPGVVTNERLYKDMLVKSPALKKTLIYHKKGDMTIREILQFVGTEIFRRMYEPVWVEALMRRIKKDGHKLALICDVRFPNEIKATQSEGGLVLGLTKDIFKGADKHASEKTHFKLCDDVIDNESLDVTDQNKAIYMKLRELGCKNIPDLG